MFVTRVACLVFAVGERVVARRRAALAAASLSVAVCVLTPSCKAPPARAPDPLQVVACEADQAREYFCDELLPRNSSRPAPEPYATCPSFVEQHHGQLASPPPIAEFDAQYTEFTRKRMPPGHSCCFSWCSQLVLADPGGFDPYAGCSDPLAIRETLCVEALESGTTQPAPEPFNRCPSAIQPPPGVSFSVPRGAIFDLESSSQRMAQGDQQCCYSWCSIAPGGTGVQGS